MAIGISGDSSPVVAASGYPAEDLSVIEQRVTNILLQMQMGNVTLDELRILRNDQAAELGLTVPVPGH